MRSDRPTLGRSMHRSKLGSFVRRAEDAPTLPGAYVLIIELAEPIEVTLRGKPKTILQGGRYLYCGSAKGSGGIRARLSRHMRPDKMIHWHVDLLTDAGRVTGAWIFPGRDECELVGGLSHLPAPIRGFGSTDCPRCWSHLLSWPRRAGNKQHRGAGEPEAATYQFGCMSKCATTICLARDG
jgi:histidyl-tRNA synthetase